ncbi:pilus assembly protein [Citrobacter sp. Cpo090]|uniref:TadE/TadG family type IV pilus assembly protein n=1 Tax=Citrobacter sp. Cpo090 TaxID=2985139 RepID=UPI0025762547|nr:TadE/TadG family type IV pilus assembly protein [Citrobacter sp. Cpo090]MDM2843536.1 pilus assembly protein [Citrobacter sp. Cpo090]
MHNFIRLIKKMRGEDGAIAVELSLVIIPFLVSILFIIELCRVMYLSSALDVVLAESGRYISLDSTVTDHSTAFEQNIKNNASHWPLLFSGSEISVKVKHCKNIADILKDSCVTGTTTADHLLSVYSFRYSYQPVFFFFGTGFFSSIFERNIVYVQEPNRT